MGGNHARGQRGRWQRDVVSQDLAEGQVAGDGQYEDATLVEHEGQPKLVIKLYHDHLFNPPEPSTSINLCYAGNYIKSGSCDAREIACLIS